VSPPRERATAAKHPAALSGKERYERFLQGDIRRSRAMAAEKAVSAAEVSGTILADLDRRSGKPGSWTVEPLPVRGRDSWVFKAHTPLAPWPLAVKVYCAAVTPEEVSAQGDHLRKYHDAMTACPGRTVPAFWAQSPEHRTLVMQWIEAPRMDDLLRQARGRRDERSRLFAAAGDWLRNYHAQSDVVERALRVKSHPRHIDMLLGGVDGAGRRVGDAVFRKSYEALIEHAESAAKSRVAHVMAHGDFVPHNVFHGGGCTVGFDMVARQRPALSDICHFLVHAEIKKPLVPWQRAWLGPAGTGRQETEVFLEAYGAPEHLGSETLAYMQLNEALLRWAVLISHRRRGGRLKPEQLISWLRYRRIAACAAATLEARR
jgi:hypothetical protein